MNKLYCFVCFIFLGTQIVHGQSLVEDKIKTPFLFSENNKAYLLTKDSIFNLSDNPWSSSLHSIDLYKYNFVGNQINSFLIHNLSQSTLVFEEGIFVAAKATVSREASNKWPFYGTISPEHTNVLKQVASFPPKK